MAKEKIAEKLERLAAQHKEQPGEEQESPVQEEKEEEVGLKEVLDMMREMRRENQAMKDEIAKLRTMQPSEVKDAKIEDLTVVGTGRECPEGATMKTLKVKLAHCHAIIVEVPMFPGREAELRNDAISMYNRHFNIISTQHPYEVSGV